MQTLIFLTLAVLLSCPILQAKEEKTSCIQLPSQIEKIIREQVVKSRGVEHCESRLNTVGDLNADGQQDIVVLYNIEGACTEPEEVDEKPGHCGNHSESYLSVFIADQKSYQMVGPLEVGGRGEGYISTLSIKEGRIESETLEYGEADAMCCPSKKGRAAFTIVQGRLKRVMP